MYCSLLDFFRNKKSYINFEDVALRWVKVVKLVYTFLKDFKNIKTLYLRLFLGYFDSVHSFLKSANQFIQHPLENKTMKRQNTIPV